jgi:hypothetical protein
MSERIVSFYECALPDNRGRRLIEIQRWSDEQLESVHDYIQWLFPLPEPSAFNASAPVLSQQNIAEFCSRADLRDRLHSSFLRMLAFYGFEPRLPVERAPNFEERAQNWLMPGNHNHLRITRILKSLRLLGLEADADAFFEALAGLYRERPGAISSETFRFWQTAS